MADKNPILEAVKRVPAQIAMGPADLLNLALGLVSGKGLKGVTPKSPSETINQDVLGLQEPDALSVQGVTELAAGLINPAKAIAGVGKATALAAPMLTALMNRAQTGAKIANKQAGIIGGSAIIEDLGLSKLADKVQEMATAGKSQNAVARETADALEKKGNPYGAHSMYMGPDGQPRIVISNRDAKLRDVPGIIHKGDETVLPDLSGAALQDVLDFPLLYQLSPTAREAKFSYNLLFDVLSRGDLGYTPTSNTVQVGSRLYVPSRLRNDPEGNMLEALLHESQHILQGEGGMRTGTNTSVQGMLAAVQDARTKGSFVSPEGLDNIERLARIGNPAILRRLYGSNYGEFEARAGSEFAPTVFPMTYGQMTW